MTTSKEFEEIERLRIKASHNEASALRNAEQKAARKTSAKIAKTMLDAGESTEKIIQYTGLTSKEIKSLASK